MRSFDRGAVQLHVLHHAAEGEIHGAWITEELARHGHRISPGTLYPTLHRMENEGLLRSRTKIVDGRRRRLYTATAPAGRPMPDGIKPGPGGWNRIEFVVDDIGAEVDRLRGAGLHFRNEIISGPGGSQILLEDPSGNLIELFQPAER